MNGFAPPGTSIIEAAMELAAAGFPVFPCNGQKKPVIENGFLSATRDPIIIRGLFTKPGAKLIGVPTGPASGFDVLDFDYRHGAKAWEDANQHQLPETRVHQSQSGGRHLMLAHAPGVRNSASRIGPGIDVRAAGGYVIVPPSPGYTVISDAPVAPWPEWLLVPGLALPKPKLARSTSSSGDYQPTSDKRLEAFRLKLLANIRQAPDGQKHEALRNNAMTLGGIAESAGFSEDDAVNWAMDALAGKNVADWRLAENTARWAFAAGQDRPIKLEERSQSKGTRHTEPPPPEDRAGDREDDGVPPEIDDPADYDALDADATSSLDPVVALVREFNGQYMVVNEAGLAIIYEPAYDYALNRRYYERITFDNFRRLYLNYRIPVPQGDKIVHKPAADVWLRHLDRRQYIGGVVFDPSGRHVRPGALNLWQGFAVKPKPGSWARLQEHILKIVCAGDTNLRDWLMGWMARLVQRPGEQGEVAIVMRGVEGCGKGTLAKALLHILGQHGMAISNAKHLTGNFNGHLRDTVLLFADEAFFAGDRAHTGVLKALITEPTLTIEGKYQNAVQMQNFVHLMMASNEEWVIPAGPEARRFLVLDVLPTRAEDTAYFAAIWGEMKNGGYEAMLHDLLAYDLTFFNHRNAPKTAGLQEQKKLSLGTSEAWWLDILHRGYVWKSKLGLEDYFSEWHEIEPTEILFASYTEYAKARNERHPMARETFGAFLIRIGAKAVRLSNAVVGERVADVKVNDYGDTRRKAELIKHPRPPGYSLGNLSVARSAFTQKTNLVIDWQDPPD